MNGGPVALRTFDDLDELASAVQHVDVEYVPTTSPRGTQVRLLRIDLGEGASLQMVEMNLPHLTRARVRDDVYQATIALRVDAGVSWNGHAVDEHSAFLYRRGSEIQAAAAGADNWAALHFPTARLEQQTAVLAGAELARSSENCRVARFDEETRAGLAALLSRAAAVAAETPGAFAAPEACRDLAQSLLGLVTRALQHLQRRVPERERTLLSHSRIVALAEECMRARLGEPLYVADLCLATGASERTLRSAFRNVYAMGPNRLLKLRRLNQVRRELERGEKETLVSEVAQRHGFWDLGRFAGDYRRVMGESPSQTLRGSRAGTA